MFGERVSLAKSETSIISSSLSDGPRPGIAVARPRATSSSPAKVGIGAQSR